eukprot:8398415-Pyramimonas_sp.AAC.2
MGICAALRSRDWLRIGASARVRRSLVHPKTNGVDVQAGNIHVWFSRFRSFFLLGFNLYSTHSFCSRGHGHGGNYVPYYIHGGGRGDAKEAAR